MIEPLLCLCCHMTARKAYPKTTCVNGCRCDDTICGDRDPYVKAHPEYRGEAEYRRNK